MDAEVIHNNCCITLNLAFEIFYEGAEHLAVVTPVVYFNVNQPFFRTYGAYHRNRGTSIVWYFDLDSLFSPHSARTLPQVERCFINKNYVLLMEL